MLGRRLSAGIATAAVGAAPWKAGPETVLSSESDPRGQGAPGPGGNICYPQPVFPDIATQPGGSGFMTVWRRSPYVLATPVAAP